MNEEELRAAFVARRGALEALGNWVISTISKELERALGSRVAMEKFLQIPPKPRVKGVDSFLEKSLIRKPKADPLLDTTDQVGVRFVVLLLEDIERVGAIVQSAPWEWTKDRDHSKERLENPDYFAYQSDHYVVRTCESLEYAGVVIPVRTPCEIQIRTILQHAYAEMAHSSDYKPSIRLPAEDKQHVKRSLAKGSALIETTDDVFKEIKARLRKYDEGIQLLMSRSCEIYKDLTGEEADPESALGSLIADSYRAFLVDVTPDMLTTWAHSQNCLGEVIRRKRASSVFYRDGVLVLLGFLIHRNESSVPKLWPVDSQYLEDFYVALGVSPTGLF